MAISQNFPNTRPSLNLNFARSKTLDPRFTFIRTTTATYVDESGIIRYASADEPRFDHDPETGRCLGLMIEEQRTNLIAYSTYHAPDGSNTDFRWQPLNGASTLSTTETAPDGTSTAWRWDGNSGSVSSGAIARIYFGPNTFTANGTDSYTVSFYAKLISGTTTSQNIRFDLQDTAFSSSYESDLVTGEWKRIVITGTPTSGTYTFMDLVNNNITDYVIDFWGVQIEKDKDVSSYIPTTGTAVARNSDNVWMSDISDFFNPSEGTSVIKFSFRFDGVYNHEFKPLFSFRDKSKDQVIGFSGNTNPGQLYFTSYDTLVDDYNLNGVGDFVWLSPTTTRNLQHTIAVSYASTYFRFYHNNQRSFVTDGQSLAYGIGKSISDEYIPHKTPSTGITTSNFTTLSFGSRGDFTENNKMNCNIESFAYYPSEVGVDNIKTFTRDQ